MTERTEIPKTQGEAPVSRRQFLRNTGEAALGVATLGVIAAAGGITVAREKKANESLIGKDVRGKEVNEYITDAMGDHDEIILRDSPNIGSGQIVGYTKPGYNFWAQAEYGTTYDSGQRELSNVQIGADHYGIWYRGAGLPVFDELKMNDGKTTLVPRLDEQGNQIKSGTVHVAGNFLVKAPQESSK